MYYATKRNTAQTRAIGLATSVAVLAGTAVAVANGFGNIVQKPPAETEVVLIEEVEEIEDEPPPPPPVDIDLPPPPPQVILPDFVFETPPPRENAISNVTHTPNPAPPPPPAPAAKPAPTLPPVRPRADPKRFGEMMTNDYPQSAMRRKQEGAVDLAMCMSADGRASNVRVIKSSGVEALDEAAVKGVTRLKFTPAKDSAGKAVAWCPPTYPEYTMQLVWQLPK